MRRPKRVYPEKLHEFNIMHTEKARMYSGVENTTLHLLKKTKKWYISLDTWAFCCSKFKRKHKNLIPKVDLPVTGDDKVKDFLNENAWHDWIKRHGDDDPDLKEGLEFLNKLYPNHKKVHFYELQSIVAAYCQGSFVSYDAGGDIEKPHESHIKRRNYYNWKYSDRYELGKKFPKNIKKFYKIYDKLKHDTPIRKEAYKAFRKEADKYILENHDLTSIFKIIGENSIVVPYAFTAPTMKGYSYEHAGEFYLVVTEDTVYFEIERHF